MKKESKDKLIVLAGVIILLTIISLISVRFMKIEDKNQRKPVEELKTDRKILDLAITNYINKLNSGKNDSTKDKIIEYKYENYKFIKEVNNAKYFEFVFVIKCVDASSCKTDEYEQIGEYLSKKTYAKIVKNGYTYDIEEMMIEKPKELE